MFTERMEMDEGRGRELEKVEIIKTYQYQGRELGKEVESTVPYINDCGKVVRFRRRREFQPELGEFETLDLLKEMLPEERIHLQVTYAGVYRLVTYFGIEPEDYISDEDLIIYVANLSKRKQKKLDYDEPQVWKMIQQRGLEERIFSELGQRD